MKSTLRVHLVVTPEELALEEQRKAKRRAHHRPRTGAKRLEEHEQAKFVAWARERGLHLWHTPNANNSVRRAQKMKALGQLAGVADVIITNPLDPVNFPNERGLAFEFKSDAGVVSETQQRWLQEVRHHGWRTYVVRSFEQARGITLQLYPWMRP